MSSTVFMSDSLWSYFPERKHLSYYTFSNFLSYVNRDSTFPEDVLVSCRTEPQGPKYPFFFSCFVYFLMNRKFWAPSIDKRNEGIDQKERKPGREQSALKDNKERIMKSKKAKFLIQIHLTMTTQKWHKKWTLQISDSMILTKPVKRPQKRDIDRRGNIFKNVAYSWQQSGKKMYSVTHSC